MVFNVKLVSEASSCKTKTRTKVATTLTIGLIPHVTNSATSGERNRVPNQAASAHGTMTNSKMQNAKGEIHWEILAWKRKGHN